MPFQISREGVMIIRKTFVQMCNGLEPRTKYKQLAEYYINYSLESEATGFFNAQHVISQKSTGHIVIEHKKGSALQQLFHCDFVLFRCGYNRLLWDNDFK